MHKCIYHLKVDGFYCCLVLKLRKSSLRKMIKAGLVDDTIKRQVLEGLKTIVTNDNADDSNGDIKE